MKAVFIGILVTLLACPAISQHFSTDVLVVGGGASGTMAAIQAARMNAKTLLIEETEWLGGMLTSAGVSAIDGNHNMPSGLWGEFRESLYRHYGGAKAVETGWVSNTLFEPAVGDKILKALAQHPNLSIWYKSRYIRAEKNANGWEVVIENKNKKKIIQTKILIDATELGDVAASLNVPYRIGMDSRTDTREHFAPLHQNDIIQDLTYVVILKDFGKGSDKTIPKPKGYNKDEFHCACDNADSVKPSANCLQMMQYGKLPNNKYMINWPRCGNDYYLNLIEANPQERQIKLQAAKLHTLRFVYYIQHELGFKNLGISEDEFPTKDHLPMIPYHRESRRIKGLTELTVDYLAAPFDQQEAYFRTGVAVGDYPIDHHHDKNKDAPQIDFINIKVPAYNVPLGSLIPPSKEGLIVAEKSISVSNIVNGATRLQPVVMGIGQAAGALAGICIEKKINPHEVNVRDVQHALLQAKAYLMPYYDVKPNDPHFPAIHRIGATGLLRGSGIPYKWANQTWFYPEHPISEYQFIQGLQEYYPDIQTVQGSGTDLTLDFLWKAFTAIQPALVYQQLEDGWNSLHFNQALQQDLILNRRMAAVLIDRFLDPFNMPVDFNGKIVTPHKPRVVSE